LEQRGWKSIPDLAQRLKSARLAIVFTLFNLVLSGILCALRLIPALIWLPFLLQASESIWAGANPVISAKPIEIGMRQLFVSTIFTILFIILWR
jgi:hypothetical protein